MMALRHLRLANRGGGGVPGSARKSGGGEYCLVDYSSCPSSDVCWLMDFDNGCSERDNCLIDTS